MLKLKIRVVEWARARPYRYCDGGHCPFCDVGKVSRATSAMMDVPIDEQELPDPVRLRMICIVSDEWEMLGRIRHQLTT